MTDTPSAAAAQLPRRWLIFLVAAIAAYLVADLSFMMVLVETASSSPSLERVMELDRWGRLLSGVAVGLLVLHFCIARAWFRRHLVVVALAFVLSVAAVFHGLGLAVQNVVEASTAEDRVEASFCAVTQRGIARAEMVIRGMTDAETPTGLNQLKAVIPWIGLMCRSAPAVQDALKHGVEEHQLQNAIEHLGGRQKIHEQYQKGVTELMKGFGDYQANSQKFFGKRDKALREVGRMYDTQARQVRLALDDTQAAMAMPRGQARTQGLALAAERWVEVAGEATESYAMQIALLTTALDQSLPGTGVSALEEQHALIVQQLGEWLRSTRALPGLRLRGSPSQQLHQLISAVARHSLQHQSFARFLPPNWDWRDRPSVMRAAESAFEEHPAAKEARTKLRQEIGDSRFGLPLADFTALPTIQARVRNEVCRRFDAKKDELIDRLARHRNENTHGIVFAASDIENIDCQRMIDASWTFRPGMEANDPEFIEYFVRPAAQPIAALAMEYLSKARAHEYEGVGLRAAQGKDAYKLLVLLPLALFCSLLGCTTHLFKLWFLSAQLAGSRQAMADAAAVHRPSRRLAMGVTVAALAGICIVLNVVGNPVTRSPAYTELAQSMQASASAEGPISGALMAGQLIVTKAVVVGQAGLYTTLEALGDRLARLQSTDRF